MVDLEFQVVSDRREGLLLALGQVVLASGFTLLRQRMGTGPEGVVLTRLVRGSPDNLLQLEENPGTHPLVRSFESIRAKAANCWARPRQQVPPRLRANGLREPLRPRLRRPRLLTIVASKPCCPSWRATIRTSSCVCMRSITNSCRSSASRRRATSTSA